MKKEGWLFVIYALAWTLGQLLSKTIVWDIVLHSYFFFEVGAMTLAVLILIKTAKNQQEISMVELLAFVWGLTAVVNLFVPIDILLFYLPMFVGWMMIGAQAHYRGWLMIEE